MTIQSHDRKVEAAGQPKFAICISCSVNQSVASWSVKASNQLYQPAHCPRMPNTVLNDGPSVGRKCASIAKLAMPLGVPVTTPVGGVYFQSRRIHRSFGIPRSRRYTRPSTRAPILKTRPFGHEGVDQFGGAAGPTTRMGRIPRSDWDRGPYARSSRARYPAVPTSPSC